MFFNRTKILEERLGTTNGSFEGRPIICRDSPIDGGVYLGAHPREAIVVDSAMSPLLMSAYGEAKQKSTGPNGEFMNSKVLGVVFDLVKAKLPYNEAEVERIIDKRDAWNDQKISLGVFLEEGAGTCRHMALLAAFLLERFGKEGLVGGQVSIDRSACMGGGHAWCRYTNSVGDVYIIDAATLFPEFKESERGFLGSLEDSYKLRSSWSYARDEDIEKLKAK